MMGCEGFNLFEIIIAVLLLSIAIAPMVNAFKPAVFPTSGEEEIAVFMNQARGNLNRVAALDFQILNDNQGNPVDLVALFGSTTEADKETFSFKGKNYTPTVAITEVSGGDGGLIEVNVTLGKVSLKTMKAEY